MEKEEYSAVRTEVFMFKSGDVYFKIQRNMQPN